MTQRDLAADVIDQVLTSDLDEGLMAERILDRLQTLGWQPPPEISPRSASPIQNGYDLALLGAGMLFTAVVVGVALAFLDATASTGSLARQVLRWPKILDGVWALASLASIGVGILIGPRSLNGHHERK